MSNDPLVAFMLSPQQYYENGKLVATYPRDPLMVPASILDEVDNLRVESEILKSRFANGPKPEEFASAFCAHLNKISAAMKRIPNDDGFGGDREVFDEEMRCVLLDELGAGYDEEEDASFLNIGPRRIFLTSVSGQWTWYEQED